MISTRCTLMILLISALPATAGELRIGAAAVKITPVVGTPIAGYYSPRGAEVVSARCAEGSGEMLVDAALRLLRELYLTNSRQHP